MTSAQLGFLTIFTYSSIPVPTDIIAGGKGLTLEFLSDSLEETLITLPRVLLE